MTRIIISVGEGHGRRYLEMTSELPFAAPDSLAEAAGDLWDEVFGDFWIYPEDRDGLTHTYDDPDDDPGEGPE